MDVSKSLSDVEIDELTELLISDETPEECMDISTLDGFLTGLVTGPDTIMPSRWLPVVWGESACWRDLTVLRAFDGSRGEVYNVL